MAQLMAWNGQATDGPRWTRLRESNQCPTTLLPTEGSQARVTKLGEQDLWSKHI
ncbi:hypothetical protein CCACVL1_13577 [Corchorus capsularis]|uniref:Uncharacterized protein n=1 Tax=Corchorus capsularis TaxID=210143 RepID=A0A1R3IAE6_COCAP|nr:hypothetical protein CCACVL1_13577 [Corchorus capsularis]